MSRRRPLTEPTLRQRQALAYRKDGLSLKQIAGRMGISSECAWQLIIYARWHEMGGPQDHGPLSLSSRLRATRP
jgi:hypothetical protein